MAMLDSLKDLKKDKTLYTILIVLIIVVVVVIIYKVYQAVQDASNVLGDQLGQQIVQKQTGISIARQNVCKQIASDCAGAVVFFPFTKVILHTSDTDLITALNRMTSDDEASLTSLYFRQTVGISLKSVIDSYHFMQPTASITYYGGLN